MSILDQQLLELETMSRALLLQQWQIVFSEPPPKNLSTKLMRRMVAYELQVKHLGGLPVKTSKALHKIAMDELQGVEASFKPPKPQITPGTTLLREWNGRTYQVEATGTGFVWNGTTYRSLSAIAKAITGAHWSGPRFFGLGATPNAQSALKS